MAIAGPSREAVAVFTSRDELEAAVDALLTHGVGRADLSLLASDAAVRAKLGHAFASTRELEDDTAVPTVAYVAREDVGDAEGAVIGGFLYVGALVGMVPILASGGAIGAAIVAALAGGGAGMAVGAVLADLIGRHHADRLQEQLDRGGLLLWVRTQGAAPAREVVEILKRHGGEDVHVHDLPDAASRLAAHYGAKAELPEVGRRSHAGFDLLVMADGHCYAAGRLFANEAEARRYLDELVREG